MGLVQESDVKVKQVEGSRSPHLLRRQKTAAPLIALEAHRALPVRAAARPNPEGNSYKEMKCRGKFKVAMCWLISRG